MQRELDDSRAEMGRLRAVDTARDTARDTEIARLRSEIAVSQQTIDLLRRQLDSSTPFSRGPPNLFRATSEPMRGMQLPTSLLSYSAANVGTPIIGQRENREDDFSSGMSRDGYWTHFRSAFDMGRSLDQSQLNPFQAVYSAGDRLQLAATQQSSATTLLAESGQGYPLSHGVVLSNVLS